MRFILLVKATAESEAGRPPSVRELTEMTRFNERLVEAGVLVAGDGLHPSSTGARVSFDGARTTVTDGPFAATEELVAGYWVLDVASRDDAIDWARRVPFESGQIEIRKVVEPADFGDVMTSELVEAEQRLRERIQLQHS